MTDDKPRLGRDVFLALAAVGWADGRLDPDEADAIVRTALDEGLELEQISEIEAATQAPLDLGTLDQRSLTPEDRLFIYAVACWLATLDGVVTQEELGSLARLGTRLGIPPGLRREAAEAAREVAEMPEGDRPDRYDLAALRWLLGERLRAAEAGPGADEDDGS